MKPNPSRARRRRGLYVGAAVSAAVLLLTGCAQNTNASPATASPDVAPLAVDSAAAHLLPAAVASDKTLRVAIPTNEPPTQYFQAGTQHLTGINPDIARLIGEALGVKINISVANFDAIIPGFAAGRYDMTVSSMTPTRDRMKVLNFVDYMTIGSTLAVARGNPNHLAFTSLCGHDVGLLSGSYELAVNVPRFDSACRAAGKPEITTHIFQDTRQAISALTSSRVQAVFADSPIVGYAAKQDTALQVESTIDNAPVSVGLAKNAQLLNAISAAVAYVIKSKAYKQALDKYGLESSAITDARVNFAQG